MEEVVPGPEVLLIFLGYSEDARQEAGVLCDLQQELEDYLETLVGIAPQTTPLQKIKFWTWERDGKALVGGQEAVVSRFLERANLSGFVFKGRVGSVTRDEVARFQLTHPGGLLLGFFPKQPPPGMDRGDTSRAWDELVHWRDSLTEDWTDPSGAAVKPIDRYEDHEHLHLVASAEFKKAIKHVVHSQAQAVQTVTDNSTSPFIEHLTTRSDLDLELVSAYRKEQRTEQRQTLPDKLDDFTFLNRLGVRRRGLLTHAGVLLFTRYPHETETLPGARVRCTRFRGVDKSATRDRRDMVGPIQDLIRQTYAWIEESIDKDEMPVAGSPKSSTDYRYPMTCVRELIANALCHRDYESPNLTYVSLFRDRIEIENPGQWGGKGLTFAGREILLKDIDEKCNPPNSRLAHSLSAIDLVEMLGSGIITAVKDCDQHDAPYPTITEDRGYVLATIRPCGGWATRRRRPGARVTGPGKRPGEHPTPQPPPPPGQGSDPWQSAELLDRWREGDDDAGNEFIKKHSTVLKRFFERKVDGKLVEDLIAATFDHCLDASENMMVRCSTLSVFLFKVAREELLSQLAELPVTPSTRPRSTSNLESTTNSSTEKIIVAALRQQALGEQILVDLVLFHRLTLQEASEVIATKLSEGERRLRRALHALASHIREHEPESIQRSKALEFVGFLG